MSTQHIPGYCSLCISRCGSVAVIEDGRFVALEPDPTHPTGKALCAKGRAAPELVYSPQRLLYPLKRTRPKGDPDPGWQRISWDEALDTIAARLRQIASESGPESVAFAAASPSTSAIDDANVWISRLMNAFGTPNLCAAMELCGWGRYLATQYTFGAGVPGNYMPDLENAGVILFWGYNPNLARLSHATATVEAQKRGAKLIVVDPRRTGPAKKADLWLQVRPGTDGALALGIAAQLIANGLYDSDFLRQWTNAPLLVRLDNGRFLSLPDAPYLAWDASHNRPARYDPAAGYDIPAGQLALTGTYTIETPDGMVACRPAFDFLADLCHQYPPEKVEAITSVPAAQVQAAAQMIWDNRPLAYYAWSGVEMQTSSTAIARAIAQLCVLTASFDVPGGNVLFTPVPSADVEGHDLLPPSRRPPALGQQERPLGPARWGFINTADLYRAILDRQPYPVRGLLDFGSNLLLSHADPLRGRAALAALDFYVHADLFMNPTAELADIVLPVASAFESEALKFGFLVSQAAQNRVQLRPPVVAPQGGSRSDTQIIFDLAVRLGYGDLFWDGDIDAANRYRLAPSGLSLEELRLQPGGIQADLPSRYRKFADVIDGQPRGFRTPSRKIELYSQTLLDGGYDPLPAYEPPLQLPSPSGSVPLSTAGAGGEGQALAARFPLILTSTKNTLFCESQHRGLPSLRRQSLEPEVELHPQAAAERGIHPGDWVMIETRDGAVRARARFNPALDPQVVCGQHGWWQAAPEIGAPAYDPFTSAGANYNLLITSAAIDPVSGSVPHRAYACQLRLDTAVVTPSS